MEMNTDKESENKQNEFTEVFLDEKRKKKLPRRRVYFSDGYLDEYSTEEEEQVDNQPLIDTSTLPWLPYIWHVTWWLGTRALAVCDYLGEHLAYFLGITTPKFQYEIDQYKKLVEEEEALRKKVAAENAGWGEASQDSDSFTPIAKEPVPTQVSIGRGEESDAAKESREVLAENDSRKWQRY